MIILIHGDDSFRSSLKTKELLDGYRGKNWDIFQFDFFDKEKEVDLNELKSVLETQGLFSNSRVIVIRNWLTALTKRKKKVEDTEDEDGYEEEGLEEEQLGNDKDKLKEVVDMLEKNESKDLVIILEEKKEIKNTKILGKLKFKSEEFPLLKDTVLIKWIKGEMDKLNLDLDKTIIELLAVSFEGDTGSIFNELQKLSLLGDKVSLKDFLKLTVLPDNPINFELANAIASKNRKVALKALYKEIESGKIPVVILGSILYQIRSLLMIKTLEQNSRIDPNETELHSFVIMKNRALVKKYTIEELKKAYRKLFQYDVQGKKGKIDPLLALELFINGFTS